jgi:hypothetical protein
MIADAFRMAAAPLGSRDLVVAHTTKEEERMKSSASGPASFVNRWHV